MPDLKDIGLEEILDRHLGQVAAPEELWRRVAAGTRPQRSRPLSRRLAWSAALSMAAAMVAGGLAWTLHPRSNAALESANAGEIRTWVQAQTGLEVPLRDSASVRLMGAHVTNHAVEIAYRTGGHEGTLTVERSAGMVDNHRSAVEGSTEAKLISWAMRGQFFTLACDDAEQAHAACLLCHS